ncbi:hypothetical protein TNCV_240481 [Trichonephila clavipes]|nr:hypothetical protein TNCV_240481 [Trichonephila clavipes]
MRDSLDLKNKTIKRIQDVQRHILYSTNHRFSRNSARSPAPSGKDSYPRESMDVCKCGMPSSSDGTLNSRLAACPLVRFVEGEEKWEAPNSPGVFSLKVESELSQSAR